MEYVDPRCVYRILILSAVLSAWARVEAAKATPPVERIAGSCLNAGSKVTIKCPSANQNIDIISVAYAHTPNGDCNNPLADNDCQGPSDILSLQAQAACNGANLCLLDVVTLQEFANLPGSTNDDLVQPSYSNCDVNNQLLSTGTTNTMQVKYECIEYEFCNAISDSVPDLTIATKGFPAKSVTNPSCSCDFESEDAEVFALTGYAHCNGTVIFVVEETGFDGTVSSLEYVCENKLQQDHILIGNKEPWKVSVTVDVEQSDEDSAYQISWYNIKPQGFARKKGGLIKVDCKAGRLWLPYRVKLILMIVLPIVSAIIIALIVIYCICKKRRKRARRRRYEQEYFLTTKRMVEGEGSEQRTEPVADGKSASSMYEQPEPWHSNPEVQMNELAKPRYKSHLHKSHSAIPSYRNNDLALSRDPRLSRSRQSVRSLKRQAPQPPGQAKLFDNDSERRTLLNPQNIEADVEPLPGSLTPTAPSVTPPRDFHSSADVSPRSSPLDNVRTEPMVPYRRKHNGKSKSTKRNSYDPAAPLSLLTLDSSYTQPPKDSSMLTRNYSGKSNRSTPRRELDSTNQTPDNSRHDFRASPQSNNDFLSSDEEPPSTDRSARYSPAEAAPSDSEQDDMTIMRPKLTPEAKRLRSKPFTGYKGVSPDEHCEEFTNINPGDECEFHK